MRVEAMGEDEKDEFPVGMRVLAVDDDPCCLKLLVQMLLYCRYHVTATNRAVEALEMLRENKDKFDLIVTDVCMPDMDGFKLLELVGLEMDLPVIMMSVNDDTKLVMKGITHGACDYLIKPVKMDALKNIWQHVIRKKKSVSREHNHPGNATSDSGQGPINSGSSEYKGNRKRKDQREEDDDGNEENMNENESSNSQKKARVVWSVDLHRKFMAAVNHLGHNNAVPKRILDLMNVEGLTRENVASHLQKYRLYMKKLASHEANLAAAFGVRDPYVPLSAMDSFADFHSFASSSQQPALQSLQQNEGLIRRDHTVFGHNSISHGQVGLAQRTSDPTNDINKLQHVLGSQHGNLFQSISPNLGVEQLQNQRMQQLQQKRRLMQEGNHLFSATYPASGLGSASTNNPIIMVTSGALTSISSGLLLSGPSELNPGVSSDLLDSIRIKDNLQSAIPSSSTINALPMNRAAPTVVSRINCSPLDFSSGNMTVASSSHPLIGNTMLTMSGDHDDSKYLNFGSVGNSQYQWRGARQDHAQEPNILHSSASLAGQSIVDPASHILRQNSGNHSKRVVPNMDGLANYDTLFLPQFSSDKSIADGQLKYKDENFPENSTVQGGLTSNGYNFDELVNMIKPEREDTLFMDM